MQSKRLSTRRTMAIEQTQKVYQRLYGNQPSNESYNLLSAAELEALAERMAQVASRDIDPVAVLGYN